MQDKRIKNLSFQAIDWSRIVSAQHKSVSGETIWKAAQYQELRLKIVEYSQGIFSDLWCSRAHIIDCLKGGFISEL